MKYTIEELSIWKSKILNVQHRRPEMYYTQSTKFAMPHILKVTALNRIHWERN